MYNYRKQNIIKGSIIVLALVAVIGSLVIFGVPSFTDEDTALKVLQSQGYKDIQFTGYRFFMKGEGDTYSTGFEATSITGARVSGAVTSGLFKGATVRFD